MLKCMNTPAPAGNPWILGSPARDFAMLLLPGILGFALARLLPQRVEFLSLLVFFLVYGWIDNGHVYTTIWRTLINKQERARHSIYLWGPLACVIFVLAWAVSGWPGLWLFAVYITLFHNFRQLWGFNRWYQKLAGRSDRSSSFFFHGLLLLPAVAYHTRPFTANHYYLVPGDLFHWPHWPTHLGAVILWCALLVVWLGRESLLWRQGIREPGRLYGFGAGIIIYGGAFFLGERDVDLAFPLVLSHGISYLAVSAQTSKRLGLPGTHGRGHALAWMFATALIGGMFAYSMTEMQDFESWQAGANPFLLNLAIALYLGPLYAHYLFDAWLWTGKHPEAKAIFAPHSTQQS